jgi:hypothetical protein
VASLSSKNMSTMIRRLWNWPRNIYNKCTHTEKVLSSLKLKTTHIWNNDTREPIPLVIVQKQVHRLDIITSFQVVWETSPRGKYGDYEAREPEVCTRLITPRLLPCAAPRKTRSSFRLRSTGVVPISRWHPAPTLAGRHLTTNHPCFSSFYMLDFM